MGLNWSGYFGRFSPPGNWTCDPATTGIDLYTFFQWCL